MTQLQAFVHDFPSWLNASLDAARWKRADLAKRTGITKGHISNIMNGKANPTMDTVARIIDALEERLGEIR